MKEDLAGGKLPSADFGEKAAWWWMMILAMNLTVAMKPLVLKGSWISNRLKAWRFGLINLPGRVLLGAWSLIMRPAQDHPALCLLQEAKGRSAAVVPEPSG